MPVIIEFPIAAADVPRLDAVLVTRSDNDHYSDRTCRDLARVTGEYHSTQYVASLMKQEGLPAYGHDIGEHFAIGPVDVEVTPADHAWQNESPARATASSSRRTVAVLDRHPGRHHPGAGRFTAHPDHHLRMPTADAMLFDFSDSEWHFGLDGAIAMANAYPHTPLLLYHWGSVDAPDFHRSNADPESLPDRVENPERIYVLAPGEPFMLRRLQS
jgi:L-ascorbate metabolism protein UlaG (beta-lactamase superfamily)